MSGRTGRLFKGLVRGRQLANEVSAVVDLKKQDGIFQVECVVKDGKDPAAVEAAVYEEIERLQREPVPAVELQKVKNQAKANAYRRLSSPSAIQFQLLYYEGLGDWTYINTYADEVNAATAEDIQRVAKAYFTRESRTVGVFLRKRPQGAAGGAR
jgi:predicted Zn-dependent peptidase